MESGHAYRATHLRHHRVFPQADDPEGDPARMSLLGSILWGPLFLPRLWCWAYARGRPGGGQRRWLMAEAVWAFAVPMAGLGLLSRTPAVIVYAAGRHRQLGLPAPHGPPPPPALRRDAPDPDPHPGAVRSSRRSSWS